MMQDLQPAAPSLTRLQQAWLQEIGLDRRMLAQFASPKQVPPASPVTSASPVPPPLPTRLPRIQPVVQRAATPQPVAVTRPAAVSQSDAAPQPALPVPATWEALRAHIAVCEACELHTSRGQAVFGMGAMQRPAWMIIGEAPGGQDDRVGLPFQGKAGALLQAMLASVGVKPDTPVFYTNIVKCRPLGNRTPEAGEINACMPFLRRQIELLQPQRILALGRLAAQALLGVDADLEALRQKVHHVTDESGRPVPLVATYHPASLLLRSHHKADAWADLNLARSVVGAGAGRA